MSLNWDISKVKNADELYKTVEEDGKRVSYMGILTESLIWATIPVGIGTITEKNAEKFFKRLRIVEAAGGNRLVHPDGRRHYITLEEVRRHIGLSTNASRLNDSEFIENLFVVYAKYLKDEPETKQGEVQK